MALRPYAYTSTKKDSITSVFLQILSAFFEGVFLGGKPKDTHVKRHYKLALDLLSI